MGILADIFGGSPRVKILEVFVENPKDEISVPEIERISDVSKVTIYKYIEGLLNEGIIKCTRKIDKAALYTINLENATAKMLISQDRATLLGRFEKLMKEEGIEIENPYLGPKTVETETCTLMWFQAPSVLEYVQKNLELISPKELMTEEVWTVVGPQKRVVVEGESTSPHRWEVSLASTGNMPSAVKICQVSGGR